MAGPALLCYTLIRKQRFCSKGWAFSMKQKLSTARMLFIALSLILPATAMAQFSESYNFLKAVRERDGSEVTKIVSKPGSVIIDTKDQANGETALHIVTGGRDIDWLNFLLFKGAKPDSRDKRGNTALMIATQIGFDEGAALLLKSRASVDLANNGGETPLIRAVQLRNLSITRMLLAAGANPNKADRMAGLSARDYAKRDARGGAILKLIDGTREPGKVIAGPKL
jgi:uncharacterized protein